MARPRATSGPPPPPVPWDLEQLPAAQLAPAYADVAAFVTRLQAQGIDIPACWYTHGWLVARLAALAAWRAAAYAPGASPRDAAEWWAVGVAGLQRDWEPLTVHQGRHPPPDAPWDDPVPVPELAAFVQAAVRARATHDPTP
ncbi:MAG TPA: hypothetical protein VMW47_13155 [Verrucomicrobiae bacterium]|nr:hypothetical protein [Verrucomicrobiae bacterium]